MLDADGKLIANDAEPLIISVVFDMPVIPPLTARVTSLPDYSVMIYNASL